MTNIKKVELSEKEILASIFEINKKYGKVTRRMFDTEGITTCSTARKLTGIRFNELRNKALNVEKVRNYNIGKKELDADIMRVYVSRGDKKFTKDYY